MEFLLLARYVPNEEVYMTSMYTRNVLDCDQSDYSSRIVFSYFYHRTIYELDRMNRFRDMAIQNYTRRLTAAILDFRRPENPTIEPNVK